MNPDVVEAVAILESRERLTAAQAQLFGRVARRELVSLHAELRLLAYAGVLLVMAGVGILVQQNLDRIGPLTIAGALGGGALLCLLWVARRAPAFSWGEVASPHLAFDYVLLLGALLVAAELAYVEAKFTPLGDAWPWHLLIAAVLYGLLAFRCDSRLLLSLALSTFAAWRGVSTARLQHALLMGSEDLVRANAAGCGILFLGGAVLLRARDWKPHFEPVATHLGWLLLLAAPASALGIPEGSLWALALGGLALVPGVLGYRQRRFSLLAIGIVALYVAVSALALRATHGDDLAIWWFALTPLLVVMLLIVAQRRLREPT